MKKLIERITRLRAGSAPSGAVAPPAIPEDGLPTEPEPGATTETPAPKPPPELPLFFMLSHLDDDGPVRLDGVKLGVCEVMGLELDEPKLGPSPGRSTPWTSRRSCSSGSTRPAWKGCGRSYNRPSRRTFHRRPEQRPSPWAAALRP